jgi:hypothetical protein
MAKKHADLISGCLDGEQAVLQTIETINGETPQASIETATACPVRADILRPRMNSAGVRRTTAIEPFGTRARVA